MPYMNCKHICSVIVFLAASASLDKKTQKKNGTVLSIAIKSIMSYKGTKYDHYWLNK